jgi:hypothetical protein
MLRAHLAGQTINLSTQEVEGAASLAQLRKALGTPVSVGATTKPSFRMDLLDSHGRVVRSIDVADFSVAMGNRQYEFARDEPFLRPFHKRYSQLTYYYPDGARRAEGVHDRLQKHGPWTYYHPNGTKSEIGSYSWGRKVGKWTQWDEHGNVVSEIDYGP